MSDQPRKRLKQTSLHDCFQLTKQDSNTSIHSIDSSSEEKGSSCAVTTEETLVAPSTSNAADEMFHKAAHSTNSFDDNECRNAESEHHTVQYSMSPELFTDSGSSQFSETSASEPECPPSASAASKPQSLGTPRHELRRTPECGGRLPPLKSTHSHTVMFRLPHEYSSTQPPSPYPSCYDVKRDKWDSSHVRMPCSHHNEYPVNGKAVRRWNIIEKALLQDIRDTVELQDAILIYNARYSKLWDFSALHQLFLEVYPADKTKQFFDKTVKDMVRLALQLPHLCTQPIPMLRTGERHGITLSQQQVASLLANAFFCTFPRRNAHHRNSEYVSYPNINFSGLFSGGHIPRKVEKLKCIIHYFTRVISSMPTGCVTYRRRGIDQSPDWSSSRKFLTRLHVSTGGTIEDDGRGMLQVDFANKFLGGGVLGHGCVQEEIRFLICPEMILSKLFTEVLDKNECLVMTGCERFSDYLGYADTFRWRADHSDTTARDSCGRLLTEVVAIDALVIYDYSSQFKSWAVHRELNKAYCGFMNKDIPPQLLSAVCTGNWGCGAFGGDKRLKALLQLMAASEADRDVCFFTFHDESLCRDLHDVHALLSSLNICDILLLIHQYYRNVCLKSRGLPLIHLYDYLTSCLMGNDNETDEDSNASQDAAPPSNETVKDPPVTNT